MIDTIGDAGRAERQRRHSNFIGGVVSTIATDIGFGAYFLASHQLTWMAAILLANAVLQALGWWLYDRSKDLDAAFVRLASGGMVILLSILFVSFGGTTIYWVAMFGPVTFLLTGYKRGLWLCVAFFAAYLGIIVAKGFGLAETPYTIHQHIQGFLAASFMFFMAFAGERAQEKFRRALVAQRERLDVILRSLPVGVLVFDAPSGKVSQSNEAAERLLEKPVEPGLTAEAFAESYGLTREDGKSPENDMPAVVVLREARQHAADLHRGTADRRRVLSVIGAPVLDTDGTVESAVLVLEDSTKRYEIDQMKSEFVSLASHQLRTPLTSVKWELETLLGGDLGALPTEQSRAVEDSKKIVDRLLRLVGDLLSVSRIETGRKFDVRPESMNVAPVLMDIVKEQAPVAAPRKISLSTEALPAIVGVVADADKIREVFMNLVSNAVKYSKDGGRVELGLRTDRKDVATLFVKDDGLGIPREQQKKIFEKFFRAENVAEDIEGTGLGLYIVKSIVDRHDGRIWFESEEGVGTTFYVELPVAE